MVIETVTIDINSKSFEYDKTYPDKIKTVVSRLQWEEFCESVDASAKKSKNSSHPCHCCCRCCVIDHRHRRFDFPCVIF